ncbi:MAG: TAXI family TRAP transporter solute-binding subunit [Acetomicrobium sp.]|jgi:hypothetical protein|nr:TAXI family TRAP transporter solute-binding subunit [Acetomicrobium sp.]
MIRNIMNRFVVLVAVVLFTAPAMAAPQFLTIAGGPVGGEWYILAGTIAELVKQVLPETKVNVTTGGGIANLTSVQRGKVDLATTQDQLLFAARERIGAFSELEAHDDVMGLCYLSEIYMGVFLVREGFEVNSIAEIAEKKIPIRILTSPKASTPSLATDRMLAEYGVTPEKLREWGGNINYVSYQEVSSLIADGHADAYCGPIMPAIIELSVVRRLKVLPVDEEILKSLNKKYKYGLSVIPKGVYYFIPEDTKVFTETPILIVNKKMDEETAYLITKIITENPDRIAEAGATYKNFTPEKMPNIVGGPIHPGALKYYKGKGWIK